MSTEYKFLPIAYAKVIIHAAKFPHCAVNGILLAEKSSVGKKQLIIADAVPLFHQCLFLSPMAEIALIQIEAIAESRGLVIGGYYTGAELYKHNTIDKAHGVKIAEKICENLPQACCAIIDNRMVTLDMRKPALSVYRHAENRWSLSTFNLDDSSNCLTTTSSLLKNIDMYEIVDFDNHLDNPSSDWTNKGLNDDLTTLLAMKS